MKPLFPDRQSGASLLELIVAAGLLSVVAFFAAQFFTRVSKSEYEARAKTSAISMTALYMTSIERDLKLRDIEAASTSKAICGAKCKSFSIVRKVRVGSSSDGNMKVTFETRCESIPNSMKSRFQNSSGQPFDFSKTPKAQCMPLSGCKPNTYPQIRITLAPPSGASIPSYPNRKGNVARFPELDDKTSAAGSVIGAAICAESKSGATGSDRVTIDTAYLTEDGRYLVEKRDVTLPRSNTAKVQILPSR